jgi:hypothetical protein
MMTLSHIYQDQLITLLVNANVIVLVVANIKSHTRINILHTDMDMEVDTDTVETPADITTVTLTNRIIMEDTPVVDMLMAEDTPAVDTLLAEDTPINILTLTHFHNLGQYRSLQYTVHQSQVLTLQQLQPKYLHVYQMIAQILDLKP